MGFIPERLEVTTAWEAAKRPRVPNMSLAELVAELVDFYCSVGGHDERINAKLHELDWFIDHTQAETGRFQEVYATPVDRRGMAPAEQATAPTDVPAGDL